MKPVRRQIRLTFPPGSVSAVAELLDDEAPEVCRMVWDRLPQEQPAIHGMYSGAEIFVLLPETGPAPPENQVQIPLPGEILYFHDPGGNATSRKGGVSELVIVYGRGVLLRGPEGAPAHANLFARIPGDWMYDWPAFAQECRKARWEGPRPLRIERVEANGTVPNQSRQDS